ncbi:galactokinase [Salibacterium halotolerans]|uniref:Galactokinase n=1 Tax=Salibacterium halotolerans TaxID=1884432 RepID=A0A1I5LHZ1_9BACI|nr:galactokinase [Salibacterium halotolerans]SFO96930.1 galactokinase [Salibacterium halotolerans]
MQVSDLKKAFTQKFGEKDIQLFFAPGRINLIGEHTDYNGGNVFPCAITKGTYALASGRSDRKVRLYSENMPESGVVEVSLDCLDYREEDGWVNYPKGMIYKLIEAGWDIPAGMDVLYYGNIPNGAGLSSSASMELVTGVMLEYLCDLRIDRVDLVKTGQKVENEYIGVNSGIMDQFAIGMGRSDHGILLDCHRLQYEYAPLHLHHYTLMIMNTNKERTLAGSKYNDRRSECEAALEDLKAGTGIEALGALGPEEFEKWKARIRNETAVRRARHAVYENDRTKKSLQRLKDGDLQGFGALMNASHVSLRDDYEVTGEELDTLVEAAWEQEGVLGARMTGAGFGGCAIALVETEKTEAFRRHVAAQYEAVIGYAPSIYEAKAGDGAKPITGEVVIE